MARLWQCGFESGTLNAGVEITTTGGSPTVQSTIARTGTYALRINTTTSTAFARYHPFTTEQAIVGYQRIYLRIDSLPSASTYILRFADTGNNPTAAIRLTTAGKLQLYKADSTQLGSDSATLSTGTWYRIELKCDATTSPGAIDARLDGTSFASGSNSSQGSWCRLVAGVITTNATADLYFDDWALNDASGSNQTSWPGDGKIIHLTPNGDGDAHAWNNTSNGAGSATNYQLVNETPPNDATNYVRSVVAGAEESYTLTDSGIGASDTVNVVAVFMRLSNVTADATTAVKAQIKKTSGGTTARGSAVVPNTTSWVTNQPSEPRNPTLVLYADPDGNPWTQTTLDSAQAGVQLATAGTQQARVTWLAVSVDYTPNAGTNATVNASVVAAATTAPTPTLSAGETASPSAVAASTSAPAPTLSAGATVSPATVTAVSAVPAPDIAASSTTAPASVAAVAAIPATQVETSSTLGPAAINAAATIPAPAVTVLATAEPAQITAAASAPTLDLSAGSTVSASSITATTDLPAAVLAASATATPGPLSATAAVLAPSVSADGNTTVQPASLAASVALPTPGLSASAQAAPAPVSTAVSVPSPAVEAGAAATPGAVQGSAAIPPPGLSTGSTAAPTACATAATIPAPALAAGAAIEAVPITAASTIPAPSVAGHATVQAAALALAVTLPTPAPAVSMAAQPSAIAVTATFPAPSVTAQTEQDITVTLGALTRGWGSGELARGWSVGAPTT